MTIKDELPQHITGSAEFADWQSAVAAQRTELSLSDFTSYTQRVRRPLSTEFSLTISVPPAVFNHHWRKHPREVVAQTLRSIADQIDGSDLAEDDDREPPGDFPVWIWGAEVGTWAFTNLPEHDTAWLTAVTAAYQASDDETETQR